MDQCFRPGDLIKAEVLSLGTMREYYLTTAKSNLGVIWAQSLAGFPMIAISFEEMRCPETAQVEKRKVANTN
jgi:exosome complex component CSL4